jgi:hypothetical protein
MRNGQNKRMRGRNRKSHNPLTRVYESNGPDVKIRGTASHVAEKYVQLARDAQASGDPVGAENYFQHAEHYFRLIAAAQEQFRQNQPNGQFFRPDANDARDDAFDDGDEDMGGQEQGTFGGQPAFGTRDPQPYLPRDAQFFPQREQPQGGRPPSRNEGRNDAGRNDAARNDVARSEAARNDDDGDVERLPSFITGGAPASPPAAAPQGQNGSYEGQGGADRFPLHRRRRRHRPRGENTGQGAGEGADERLPQGTGE